MLPHKDFITELGVSDYDTSVERRATKIDCVSSKRRANIVNRQQGSKQPTMCDPERQCDKPENLKTTPEECILERIKACYVDVEEHLCAEENNTE